MLSGDDDPSSVIFDIRCNRGNGGGDSIPSSRLKEVWAAGGRLLVALNDDVLDFVVLVLC